MFEIGKNYRVRIRGIEGAVVREGPLLAQEGDLIAIDVEGVRTVFHLAGAVLYVEEVNPAAEEARDKARAQRNIAAWS